MFDIVHKHQSIHYDIIVALWLALLPHSRRSWVLQVLQFPWQSKVHIQWVPSNQSTNLLNRN